MPLRTLISCVFISLMLSGCSSSQPSLDLRQQGFKAIPDQRNSEQVVLIGSGTWQEWKVKALWSSYEPVNYTPDEITVEEIKSILNASSSKYTFKLFAGSWCGDSESEVPKIMRLLEVLDIGGEKFIINGVNREKQDYTGTAMQLNILRVPSLLIFKNGREVGRVVETPDTSWENDIALILKTGESRP